MTRTEPTIIARTTTTIPTIKGQLRAPGAGWGVVAGGADEGAGVWVGAGVVMAGALGVGVAVGVTVGVGFGVGVTEGDGDGVGDGAGAGGITWPIKAYWLKPVRLAETVLAWSLTVLGRACHLVPS